MFRSYDQQGGLENVINNKNYGTAEAPLTYDYFLLFCKRDVNVANIARAFDVSTPTINRWLAQLEKEQAAKR